MKKTLKGVYRYDGEIENTSNKPLILVHPWYEEGINKFNVFKSEIKDFFLSKGYKHNLDMLLSESYDRNIFLFEGEFSEKKSCRRILEKRGGKGLYVIQTHPDGPAPLFSSWNSILRFIKDFNSQVDIAGGYVCRDSEGYYGCLGLVYHEL